MAYRVFCATLLAVTVNGRFADEGRKLAADQPTDGLCKGDPIRKARVTFPQSIGGRSRYIKSIKDMLDEHKDFNSTTGTGGMWSGYVNVTEQDWLFYWFFENQEPMPPIVGADGILAEAKPYHRPLIIWSNGGPGCSAMEGATTENGPLRLLDMKKGAEQLTTHQLTDNWSSWNKYANVLYVDQPRYVGFSYGYGPKIASSKDAGLDFVQFILGWMDLFPQYKRSDIFLSSESYGGHFVPAWADAINDFNEKEQGEKEEVQGKRLRGSKTQTQSSRSKIDDSDRIRLRGLLIGNGQINNTVQNADTYHEFLDQAMLLPEDYNYAKTATVTATGDDSSPTTPAQRLYAEKQDMDKAMTEHLGYTPNYYDYRLQSETCPACVSYNYTSWSNWFLLPEVTTALNVCGNAGEKAFAGSAAGCISLPGFDQYDDFQYSEAIARSLNKGIEVMMYYGKNDRACDFVGGYKVANSLEWSGAEHFNKHELKPLIIGGQEMGQWKSHGGLTFAQIEDAGHMVPLDQPAAGAWVLNKVLKVNVRDSI